MKSFFKWLAYIVLGLIATIVVAILFVLNSTRAIEWAADKYALQFGFGYQKISGGLLSGLEVDGLTFQEEKLLDHFALGWNPAPLLHKKVSITHIEATGLNVKTIEKIVTHFSVDTPDKEKSTYVLPVAIGIGEAHVSVDPFTERNITIEGVDLKTKEIYFADSDLRIDEILLSARSGLANLSLEAGMKEREVVVTKLVIDAIDTAAIDRLVKSLPAAEASQKEAKADEVSDAQTPTAENLMFPKSLLLESGTIEVKPVKFPQFSITKGRIDLTSVQVDLVRVLASRPNAIQVGRAMLAVDSNLSELKLNARLENETVTIDSLDIHHIDTLALSKIAISDERNKSTEPIESKPESKAGANEKRTPNPFIPKLLVLKKMDASIKSAEYEPVLLRHVELNASDIHFDIPSLTAKSGTIDLDANTSFAVLRQHGVIQDNRIETNGYVTPLKRLFTTYDLPLREDAFGDISLDIDANEKQAVVDILIKGKKILKAEEDGFNVDSLQLKNHIVYLIDEGKLTVTNEGNVTTPYTEHLRLDNRLTFQGGKLQYEGEMLPGPLTGIEGNYTKPLNDLKISYEGNISSIAALIDSEGLKGKFVSPDFKKGDFVLSTKAPLMLNEMVSLPEPLQAAKVGANIHVPLDFAQITPLKAEANVTSNIAHIKADLLYDGNVSVTTRTLFPKDSLLRGFSKELNLDALSPLNTNLSMRDKWVYVDLTSQGITSKVTFDTNSSDIDGDLIVGGAKFIFDGNLDGNVTLDNHVASLQTLIKKINTIYRFEAPPLDGDMKISLVLQNKKDLSLNLASNALTYKADRKTDYVLNDTLISLGFSDSVLKLNRYHTTFQEQKIFATKPSIVSLRNGMVEIAPFWINDELKVTGQYNIEEKKGEIIAKADSFTVTHEMIDMKSAIDIKTRLDGVKTDIVGTVTILGGNVHYNMDKKSFASDSDIIIVQDMKKESESLFMDNLTVRIKVNTKKPILYKTADADIKALADLQIEKAPKGPIYVLGTAELMEGSYYAFENKKFVFKKSIIAFTGNPSKPILDIKAVYNSINYEITIQVTGNPETPGIIFSSIPRLSKEEILSVILFDSEEAAGNNNGEEMMKMMGGAMAKSALANVGIKIDHLALGADGSMEIGKKITDKITIIYVNDEVAGAKLQYDYSKDIKAVISTDSESSGADIIYKREFKKLPFTE